MGFNRFVVSKPVDNFHTEVNLQNNVLPEPVIFLVKLHNPFNMQVLFQLFVRVINAPSHSKSRVSIPEFLPLKTAGSGMLNP